MMAPCEYCGRLTRADEFMSYGVPACCLTCRKRVLVPALVLGVGLLIFLAWFVVVSS